MFDLNMLTSLAQLQSENPTLFPFPFGLHIGFSILAFIFFIYRFASDKKLFQLIFAVAIPFTLTLELFTENRTWFYTVGAIELVLIICAFVSSFISKKNSAEPEAAQADTAQKTAAEDEAANAEAAENDGK